MLKFIAVCLNLHFALALQRMNGMNVYPEGISVFGLFFIVAMIGGCVYCYLKCCRGRGNQGGRNRGGWFGDNSSDASDRYFINNSAIMKEDHRLHLTTLIKCMLVHLLKGPTATILLHLPHVKDLHLALQTTCLEQQTSIIEIIDGRVPIILPKSNLVKIVDFVTNTQDTVNSQESC